jgi:hypothetical protein
MFMKSCHAHAPNEVISGHIALCPVLALFRFVWPRHMNTHFLTVPWGRIPEVRTSLQMNSEAMIYSWQVLIWNGKNIGALWVERWLVVLLVVDISWYFLSNYSRRIAAFCVCESSFSGTFFIAQE